MAIYKMYNTILDFEFKKFLRVEKINLKKMYITNI